MFRITEDPSSGSLVEYLAKIHAYRPKCAWIMLMWDYFFLCNEGSPCV